MKILIADDESHVIQAIRLLVPWTELGIDQIFTASSGKETLNIITQENPQIVITDIVMADLSGIDIMNFIASNYPETRVIAVSGHNDFEYVRIMLTKGCLDYLLKPLESSTLIAAVKKAINDWAFRQQHKQQHRYLSTFYSEIQLFQMLYCPKISSHQECLLTNSFLATVNSCKVLYYNITFFPTQNDAFCVLLENFEKQVHNYLQNGIGLIAKSPNHTGEVIFFLYGSVDSATVYILKLLRSIFDRTAFPFRIGVSKKEPFPIKFQDAFLQAKQAFLNARVDDTGIIASFHGSASSRILSNSQSEEKIFAALLTTHLEEVETAFLNWFSEIYPSQNTTFAEILEITEIFYQMLSHWIVQLKKERPEFSFQIPPKKDADLYISHSLMQQNMLQILYEICEALKNHRTPADVMHQIARYMEENYNKPFVQSEYAKIFYMNKDYMSRKFTSTFGVNMLTYLNEIRIQHAKELLSDPTFRIQDIAYAVGFKDEKYFAKLFKKQTHLSPKAYRDRLFQ